MADIYSDLQFLTSTLTSWEGLTLDGEEATKDDIVRSVGTDFIRYALSLVQLDDGLQQAEARMICDMFHISATADELNEYAPDRIELMITDLTSPMQTLRTAMLFDAEFRKDKSVPVMSTLVIRLLKRIYDEFVGSTDEDSLVYQQYTDYISGCEDFYELWVLPEVREKAENENR